MEFSRKTHQPRCFSLSLVIRVLYISRCNVQYNITKRRNYTITPCLLFITSTERISEIAKLYDFSVTKKNHVSTSIHYKYTTRRVASQGTFSNYVCASYNSKMTRDTDSLAEAFFILHKDRFILGWLFISLASPYISRRF